MSWSSWRTTEMTRISDTVSIRENVCPFWCIKKELPAGRSASERHFPMWGQRCAAVLAQVRRRTAHHFGIWRKETFKFFTDYKIMDRRPELE